MSSFSREPTPIPTPNADQMIAHLQARIEELQRDRVPIVVPTSSKMKIPLPEKFDGDISKCWGTHGG